MCEWWSTWELVKLGECVWTYDSRPIKLLYDHTQVFIYIYSIFSISLVICSSRTTEELLLSSIQIWLPFFFVLCFWFLLCYINNPNAPKENMVLSVPTFSSFNFEWWVISAKTSVPGQINALVLAAVSGSTAIPSSLNGAPTPSSQHQLHLLMHASCRGLNSYVWEVVDSLSCTI